MAFCVRAPRHRLRKRLHAFLVTHPTLVRFHLAESAWMRWVYDDTTQIPDHDTVISDQRTPRKLSLGFGASMPSYGTTK